MISAVLAAMVLLAQATTGQPPVSDPSAAAKPAEAPNTVSPATAMGAKTKAPDDPNALVCKSEPVLGSRLSVKRCITKGEADIQRLQDRQDLERMQGRNSLTPR
jgi:hypothetical protein